MQFLARLKVDGIYCAITLGINLIQYYQNKWYAEKWYFHFDIQNFKVE
jgi:hypothetical protein